MNKPSDLFDVHGLVISEIDIGEHDKLLTILSDERGLITVKCFGARNIKSKFMATSGQFAYGVYTIKKRGENLQLFDAELIESFYDLRLDLSSVALAGYICEVISYIGTEEESSELLRLTLNTLFALSNKKYPPKKIKAVFEWKIVQILGLMPDVSGCSLCGEIKENMVLSIGDGELICDSCRNTIKGREFAEDDHHVDSISLLSAASIYAMQYVFSAPLERAFAFHLDEDDERLFEYASEDFLMWHTDKKFQTLDFYKSIID